MAHIILYTLTLFQKICILYTRWTSLQLAVITSSFYIITIIILFSDVSLPRARLAEKYNNIIYSYIII